MAESTITHNFMTSVPAPIRRGLRLQPGDKLVWSIVNQEIRIKKKGEELKMKQKITLENFEVRYRNIRKQNPKVKKCSVHGCPNPRDSTPHLGEDTCCAYHRLLFDFWSSDVYRGEILSLSKEDRGHLFSDWMKKMGKNECDKIVLRMAQEQINWEC